MQPLELIEKYYKEHSQAKSILLAHSHQVARLAVEVAKQLSKRGSVDINFIAKG